MLDELFLLNGVLNIGDSIPWIDFLDLQGYIKRMKALSKKFDRFLEHVVDEHNARRVAEGDSFVAKDMVDLLLQLADDPSLEVKLERHGVKGFTQDLLAGGTESSAVTVEWAFSELLKKPEVIKKATDELDRVIGQKRWVIQASLANLLHGFNWKLPNDVSPDKLNMEEIFGLSTPKKIPLATSIEPRLPKHVYSV
nr:cytochrome P450 71A1-like [Ipomoea trifida]